MRIAKAGRIGKPTEERGPTFTGQVWAVNGGMDM